MDSAQGVIAGQISIFSDDENVTYPAFIDGYKVYFGGLQNTKVGGAESLATIGFNETSVTIGRTLIPLEATSLLLFSYRG